MVLASTFISLLTMQMYGICRSRVTGKSVITIIPIADALINENTVYTSASPLIKGKPVGDIAYTLSGRDAFDFTIDHATGIVSMIALLK